jgi:hypothetical protein
MGEPVTTTEATVIESLALALRSATFVTPARLGVQEGAMIAICAVFGLGAPAALLRDLELAGPLLACRSPHRTRRQSEASIALREERCAPAHDLHSHGAAPAGSWTKRIGLIFRVSTKLSARAG